MKYRLKIALVLVVVLSVLLYLSNKSSNNKNKAGRKCDGCNLILISIDSFRADRVGLINKDSKITPNIDKFFKNSLIFNNYFTQAYLTQMSESSVHTGLYPLQHGAINFDSGIGRNHYTLAEILKRNGYVNIAKGTSPEFYNNAAHKLGISKGFDVYEGPVSGYTTEAEFRGLPNGAIDWISKPPKEKFFYWLNLGSVHSPFGRFGQDYKEGYQGKLTSERLNSDVFLWVYENKYWSKTNPGEYLWEFSDEDINYISSAYDSNVKATDEFLGDFFQALEKAGLKDNTIIILQSEHGEMLGEKGRYGHYDLFDEEIHTPLLIHHPGISKGKTIDNLTQSIDILPTIIEILGISGDFNFQGESLANYLDEKEVSNEDRYIFISRVPLWEHVIRTVRGARLIDTELWNRIEEFDTLNDQNNYADFAVRTNEWKLFWRKSREIQEKYGWYRLISGDISEIPEFELYNLLEDPGETVNVYDKYPDMAEKLKEALLNWYENQQLIKPEGGPREEWVQDYFNQ